jgi:hypothetical protein
VVLALPLLFLGVTYLDRWFMTKDEQYATLAAAVRAEVVDDDNWIPELLPPSATDIRAT